MTAKVPATVFPIVGLGASAGGLAAFEAFFKGLPTDKVSGMAFVLVQHLAPDHRSLLSELVRRFTAMKVFEVTNGMPVDVNCVYIIPPNSEMTLSQGNLQLAEPVEPRGHRFPIDFFFNTLAQDRRENAIGIVFSGTGRDGSVGIRAIKAAGGMVMAQTPLSAEFDGMPTSAIETGVVDFQLAPDKMLAQLMIYAGHTVKPSGPANQGDSAKDDDALRPLFTLLRAKTTHDFSLYKPSTIQRRIERRMAVHQIDSINA